MRTDTTTAHLRRACTAVLTGVLLLLPAAPAFAHGEGDSDQSRVLVLDALTYLANKPTGYMNDVTDKVGDALEAPDSAGVNLVKVRAAQRAAKSNDMMRARTLLQASLAPLTAPVAGEDPGTTTMPDPLTVHTSWAGSGTVFAAVSAAAVAIGLVLARRWRPTMPLRVLRAESHEWRIR